VPRRRKAKPQQQKPTHLIDTNVLLRYLIGDDPPKAARAAALMNGLEAGLVAAEIPVEVWTETVWTLESYYHVPRAEIAEKLAALLTFAGLRTAPGELLFQALQYYTDSNADFVDCLLAARAQDRNISVYTFDESDFKKLKSAWEKP